MFRGRCRDAKAQPIGRLPGAHHEQPHDTDGSTAQPMKIGRRYMPEIVWSIRAHGAFERLSEVLESACRGVNYSLFGGRVRR